MRLVMLAGAVVTDDRWAGGPSRATHRVHLEALVYFAIAPAVVEKSARTALVRGAGFGLVTYATWDLTGLAVIVGCPVGIVPIDMAWGTFLAASVSTTTYLLWSRLAERGARRQGEPSHEG